MLRTPRPRPITEAVRLTRGLFTLPGALLASRRWPRGRGETVMVVPGFMTGDGATVAIRRFLASVGYQVEGWSLGVNRGDVEALTPRVADRVAALADAAGRPIKLVGWSLGGVLAREAARRDPARVDRIVTLGTPVVGGPKYTLAAGHYIRQGIDLDALERRVAAQNRAPLPVPITAIYSRLDAIVAWRACFDDNPDNDVEYVEVRTGHAELGFSGPVFKAVAVALAARPSTEE